MTATTRDDSHVLILTGTIGLCLVAGVCLRFAETARLEPDKFRPAGTFQFSLLLLAVVVAASAGALSGKRLFSRPTAALLGAVGGGLVASIVNPMLGALAGFVVGLIVSLDLGRLVLRMALILVVGVLGVGLARRIYLDAAGAWQWTAAVVLLVVASAQVMCCDFGIRRRFVAANRPQNRRRAIAAAAALVCVTLLTLVASWFGGWFGEMYLSIRSIGERGGSVYVQWGSTWSWGPSAEFVMLSNPKAHDWATIGALSGVSGLTISGDQADDDALAEMPHLPAAWHLAVENSQITGRFLKDRKLPKLSRVVVVASPFDDEAMTHLGQQRGLTAISLIGTNVTGKGLARLGGLPALRQLTIAGAGIHDDDLRGLARLPLISLYLGDCPNIRGDGLKHLRDLKNLATLVVNSPIDERGLRNLQGIPSLRDLMVRLEEVTPDTGPALNRLGGVKLNVAVPSEYRSELRSLERQLPKADIYTYLRQDRSAR